MHESCQKNDQKDKGGHKIFRTFKWPCDLPPLPARCKFVATGRLQLGQLEGKRCRADLVQNVLVKKDHGLMVRQDG